MSLAADVALFRRFAVSDTAVPGIALPNRPMDGDARRWSGRHGKCGSATIAELGKEAWKEQGFADKEQGQESFKGQEIFKGQESVKEHERFKGSAQRGQLGRSA